MHDIEGRIERLCLVDQLLGLVQHIHVEIHDRQVRLRHRIVGIEADGLLEGGARAGIVALVGALKAQVVP